MGLEGGKRLTQIGSEGKVRTARGVAKVGLEPGAVASGSPDWISSKSLNQFRNRDPVATAPGSNSLSVTNAPGSNPLAVTIRSYLKVSFPTDSGSYLTETDQRSG